MSETEPADYCGYEWPTDCERVDIQTEDPIHQSCCLRKSVKDAQRCVWHVQPGETEHKTVSALAARVSDELAAQTSVFDKLPDGAILSGLEIKDKISLTRKVLRGADLSDANLKRADHSGAFLGRANLSDASLHDADLSDASLHDADLSDADLPGASLKRANLSDAYLRSADLSEASLHDADLSDADFWRADLSEASLKRADLSDADFWRADLSEASLNNADLSEASLNNADLSDANLSDAYLSDASLHDADLSDANLKRADLSDANLSDADLSDANLSDANLSDANLSDANLSDANLSDANLSEASLSDADLTDADLKRADLSDASLQSADLPGADFWRADLSDAYLKRADLSDADFWRADLSEASLHDADLSDADLWRADLTDADLFDADLSEASLNNADLSEASLNNADLSGIYGYQANMTGVDARNATVGTTSSVPLGSSQSSGGSTDDDTPTPKYGVSRDAIERGLVTRHDVTRYYSYPDFEDAVYENADLRGATFTNARLYQTNLTNARINAETTFDNQTGTTIYERDQTLDGWFTETTDTNAEAGAWVHRRLERLQKENALSTESRESHVRKQEAERTHHRRLADWPPPLTDRDALTTALGHWGRWGALTLSGGLTRHGESLRRVVAWSVGVIVGSALLYPWVGGIYSGSRDRLFRFVLAEPCCPGEVLTTMGQSLYFSVITFSTIGYGDLAPRGFGSQILVGVESLLGAVLVALFIFVLGRRTER
ncbi:pentapeptide repeat-containing protein (plasmid) [Haloarcula sp. NS06]|uniref:pentapeptide repeat-containing protein n=1 Tax=Haloarcula sp. NS06 TaxID=3409688 RepID=UPI003DA79080